jgi:hypothetical protein
VNELSGTIDLESTLIRAEALFRKFQRLIEAIDKKPNFPPPRITMATVAPSLFPPRPSPANKNRPSTPNSSNSNSNGQQGNSKAGSPRDNAKKIITPELRRLLSREVEVLQRKDVANNGDGFPAKSAQEKDH